MGPNALTLAALGLLTVRFVSAIDGVAFSCATEDHTDCDDICKEDSFWYGQCSAWSEDDTLTCTCFEYPAPLDGRVCKPSYQEFCRSNCYAQGVSSGGYCYPHPMNRSKGDPRCRCFDRLPPKPNSKMLSALSKFQIPSHIPKSLHF